MKFHYRLKKESFIYILVAVTAFSFKDKAVILHNGVIMEPILVHVNGFF